MRQEITHSFVYSFLKGHRLAVIATVDSDHNPEAAVIEFSETESLEIIFDTFTTFRKYRNLEANNRVALVVGWDEGQTLQIEGRATPIPEDSIEHYKLIHRTKLPDVAKFETMSEVRYFKITPHWIRYSDYTQTPWVDQEISLEAEHLPTEN